MHRSSAIAAVAAAVLLAACASVPGRGLLSGEGAVGVGHPAAPRIVEISASGGTIKFELAAPANIILLSYSPMLGVAPILPRWEDGRSRFEAGRHYARGSAGLLRLILPPELPEQPDSAARVLAAVVERERQQCLARMAALQAAWDKRSRRATAEAPPRVGADSARAGAGEDTVRPRARRAHWCGGTSRQTSRLAPSADEGRYVLLVASDAPVTSEQLRARLDAADLSGIEPHLALQRLAQFIVGAEARAWSGHYVRQRR